MFTWDENFLRFCYGASAQWKFLRISLFKWYFWTFLKSHFPVILVQGTNWSMEFMWQNCRTHTYGHEQTFSQTNTRTPKHTSIVPVKQGVSNALQLQAVMWLNQSCGHMDENSAVIGWVPSLRVPLNIEEMKLYKLKVWKICYN